jgi:hypothetical protein
MQTMTKRQIAAFIPKFNADHKYTKIVGVKDRAGLQLDVKVVSYLDARKQLCRFFINIYEGQTPNTISDQINDKYRGMREFLDQNEGIEAQVISKPKTV